MPKITKDEDYYLDYSIFLVEDTCFKLPTYLLKSQSDVFDAMFTLPSLNKEGETDDRPIRLEGTTKVDFRQLLKVLHPKQFGVLELTEEEWDSVLGLSTKWVMDDVRTLAIGKLHQVIQQFPHKLIKFGQKYDIDDWVFNGVERLVLRQEPMGEGDVTAIGIAQVLKIASIRECLYLSHGCPVVTEQRGPMFRDSRIDVKIKASYGLQSIPDAKNRSGLMR